MEHTMNNVPPTTNAFGQTDRQRLVRSMRKITAVLGETPVVAAGTPELLAPSTAHKRGFFYHASASLSTLALPFQKSESEQTAPVQEARPALFLRLPDTFEGLPSPMSPGFSPTLMSPTTPPLEQESSTRRVRMAKVARTLGENVPPALILSSPAVKRRRRASTLIMPESALEQQIFTSSGGVIGDAAPPRRSRRLSVTEGALSPTRAVSFIELSSPTEANYAASPLGDVHTHPISNFSPDAMRSSSEWLRPVSRPSSPAPPTSPTAFSHLTAPPTYDESHGHGPDAVPAATSRSYAIPHPRRSQLGQMERQEDEWTGQWGGAVGNMDDVVRGLRGLKMK
jgi:hypothetical protein